MTKIAKFKFEGFKAGQTIRARDFEDRPERGPCFVEGRIDMVCYYGSDRFPYAHYKIVPSRKVWNGQEETPQLEDVIVPMDCGFLDHDNRIELVKKR